MRIKLGIPMTLGEISVAIGGTLRSRADTLITHICTDTREIASGDLFFPLSGKNFDGENYVDEALKKSCFSVTSRHTSGDILLSNTNDALLDFARYYNKNLPYIIYRIGITGSVGKTTTKEFLKILLSGKYKVHASEGNFNNEIGLSLSILSTPPDSQILLMEMGMNHKGEISKLSKCLMPDIAIITNIGTAHIGNLGSREAIASAKLEVLDGMKNGSLILPKNEALLSNKKDSYYVSLQNSHADFSVYSDNSKEISILKQGNIYCKAHFVFVEKHHLECLLFSSAAAILTGVSPIQLSKSISMISTDNIRQTVISREGYHFYTDFYNASFESISASFESVKNLNIGNKKHLLLGDVLELGDMSVKMHYKIGNHIPVSLFEHIFLFGEFAEQTMQGAIDSGFSKEQIHINTDPLSPGITATQIRNFCEKGDLISMKASRSIKLERVLEYFDL